MKVKHEGWDTVEEYADYLRTQTHLEDVEIITLHGHKVIKATQVQDKNNPHLIWFDCCEVTNKEIYKDEKWVGNCSGCGKPMFKGNIGYHESCDESKLGISWRGCESCSCVNNVLVSEVTED